MPLLCALGFFGLAWDVSQAATLQITVLDRDGKPAPDAVVVVTPVVRGTPKSRPPMAAVINQEKMQFIPAVTVVSVGATVRFVNNDAWNHHVRMSLPGSALGAVSAAAEGNALLLPGKTEGKAASGADLVMDRVGATGASLLGCFIHGSMRGHIYVADSPWTVKTGDTGVVTFDDLPEGLATVKVWHSAQILDKAPQSITISATPGTVSFQLDVVPRRRRI
ncbi:MAG: plastocyanin [Burkholderiales bacterium PBB3]|nr:MAG: plastocyanin [Burkholderiales bacterium PBB3]